MSTSRINTALVGEGRPLSDLLAGLSTSSRQLRLKIVALACLGPEDDCLVLDHAREIGIPLLTTNLHEILDVEKAKSAIRRALGYLSIMVGALTLSGDAMTLIFYLLEGELTVRLLAKTLVLFLIAGSLVLYLGFTMRSETKMEAVT